VANPWRTLIWRLALLFLGTALLGGLVGHVWLALLLAAWGALAWQLWQLYQLERWLRDDRENAPPRFEGVWSDLGARIARLRRQSRKRKRKFGRLLEQFQQATSALPDAAVVLDDGDQILWCNEPCQALLGLASPRDVGLPVTHLLRHPSFIEFLNQRHPGDSLEFPSPVNSEVLLNARVVPYGKKQWLLLATDMTRIRRLERMRRDFVANVSHELRTPLTVIVGYLETFLDSDHPSLESWRQPLRAMRQQAGRMLHIIEDLLMLTRLESQRERAPRRPVAVPALLANILEDAAALSGAQGHRIDVVADPDLWILGCEKELRSAFSNLVFNAVRYTPAGGRIEIHWFADAEGLHLSVRDNGEGIAPQHLPRLTERFYRIDRDRSRGSGGTGLGLSIVKHVLNNHGGQLQIASELGVGSVFTCDFPRESRTVAAPPARNASGFRRRPNDHS
jgi:two-component system, OmpR family, phosphate regulon sensor histidine kinase PhoR